MLTIKVIRPDGSEYVKEASSVFLNTPKQSPTGRSSVSYYPPLLPDQSELSVNCVDVFDGTVYVMNSNGKTVSNYSLGSMPVVPSDEA